MYKQFYLKILQKVYFINMNKLPKMAKINFACFPKNTTFRPLCLRDLLHPLSLPAFCYWL
jgi:hypothetical protein